MEFRQILQYVSDYSGINATCFYDNREIYYTSSQSYLPRIISRTPVEIMNSDKTATALLTDELVCYGKLICSVPSCTIIFGPTSTRACDNLRAQRILRSCNLPTTEAGDLINYFQGIPAYSYQHFCDFLAYAGYVLLGEDVSAKDIQGNYYHFPEHSGTISTIPRQDIMPIHDAQDYERRLLSYIRLGEYDKIALLIDTDHYRGNEGILADDIMRHHKNLLIASVTLCSRAAVEGGLDYDTAMGMADSYIQKTEHAKDMNDLADVQFSMLRTYTHMVWERKHNYADGGIAPKVHHYIDDHLDAPLNGSIIANALGLSRTYLSSQFKEETGINLKDFINQEKMNEVKLLLTTTDLSIAEIANQVAFSSQSHLQTVFRSMEGCTPGDYRKKHL